jgi:hypothetical protein
MDQRFPREDLRRAEVGCGGLRAIRQAASQNIPEADRGSPNGNARGGGRGVDGEKRRPVKAPRRSGDSRYPGLLNDLSALLDSARRASARAVNALMTATYWEVGRRIVEFEQGGEKRAGYGLELLERLSADLTRRFGRGFSRQNLQYMRQFYLAFPTEARSARHRRANPGGCGGPTLPIASPPHSPCRGRTTCC